MTYTAILEAIKDALEASLPARLIAAGADPIDTFLAQPPTNADDRIVAVYLDTGDDDMSDVTDGYIVQVQLPDKRQPSDYLDAVLKSLIVDVDPVAIGYLSLDEIKWDVLYSGKPPLGGQGSFIYINLGFKRSLDDCERG